MRTTKKRMHGRRRIKRSPIQDSFEDLNEVEGTASKIHDRRDMLMRNREARQRYARAGDYGQDRIRMQSLRMNKERRAAQHKTEESYRRRMA
jgi:hypothetical protein